LLGVLKSGEKDDGKGHCRLKVFTHPSEAITGTTMTKSHHVIGFDSAGKLINQQNMISL
jgi:GTPase